jgi:prepilin-type N-terminal cleavage/methylation domain-containing protein
MNRQRISCSAAAVGAPSAAQARAERGMTLLELLVALSIFAVIASVLFPVINGALASRSAATERTTLDSEARAILDRLEQDLAGNFDTGFAGNIPPRFYAPEPAGRSADSDHVILETTTLVARGVASADSFVGGEDIPALSIGRGDQAHVLWTIDDEGRLVRQEIRPPAIQPVDWSTVPTEVLSERAGIVLEFYDTEQWLLSWDSGDAGAEHNRAPVAVRATLTMDDGGRTPFELVSTVVIPIVETLSPPRRPGSSKP